MDLSAAYIAVPGLMAAGVIKGMTGIGYSSCALPILVAAIGLRPAIAVLVLPAMATNLMVVTSTGHVHATVTRFWRLYLAALPGIALGLLILAVVDQSLATKVLGVLIIAYCVQSLVGPRLEIDEALSRSLQVPVGLLNGFFTGLTGSQVMPLMPYMLALNLGAGQLVQALNLAVISASLSLSALMMLLGTMRPMMLGISLLAIIPALLGVQIGLRLRSHINDQSFRQVVVAVLALIGAGLLLR